MAEEFASGALVIARILMGSLFIVGGLRHFWAVEPISQAIAARGVPAARWVLIVGSAYQVALGIALALGVFVPLSALGLIVFTILASVMLVNFWDKSGAERAALFNVFLSNIALVGGLLGLAASA